MKATQEAASTEADAPEVRKLPEVKEESVAGAGAQTMGASVIALAMNLLSGLMTARLLGPGGRGDLASILAMAQVAAWVFAMGGYEAMAYHVARFPALRAQYVSSWLVLWLPLSLLGVVAGQVAVSVLFEDRSSESIWLARIWMATIPLVIVTQILSGALVGMKNFRLFNITRLVMAVGAVVLYVGFWLAGNFTVETALIAQIVPGLIVVALVTRTALKTIGLARPSRALARPSLWYGAKAHGNNVGSLVSVQLDLAIMPMFLGAAAVGLYSVAGTVTTIIVAVAGSLAVIALPVAASGGDKGRRPVAKLLQVTLTVAGAMALVIAAAAPELLRIIYGADFEPASDALRILLPGAVLWAGAGVLVAGLNGVGRPGTAALAQLLGVVITIVGLMLFLRDGGIEAAAAVSSVAYASTFIVLIILYRRASGSHWGELLDVRVTFRAVLEQLRRRRAVAGGELA